MRIFSTVSGIFLSVSTAIMVMAADPVASFKAAMAGDDFQAKRAAVQAVAGLSKDDEEQALTLLVQAAGDRQASEIAINALRARTGLQKPTGWVTKGSGFPNYPIEDTGAGWSAWLSGWKKVNDEKKKLSDVTKKAKELEEKTKALEKKDKEKDGAEAHADGDAAEKKEKPLPVDINGERGPRCRVHFKNGGSKVYILLAKRTDADGNLLSIRVTYPDGGGKEVISVDSISRLEEDLK